MFIRNKALEGKGMDFFPAACAMARLKTANSLHSLNVYYAEKCLCSTHREATIRLTAFPRGNGEKKKEKSQL